MSSTILRRRLLWVLIIPAVCIISILWLRGFAVDLWLFILPSPLGLTTLFHPPAGLNQLRMEPGPVEYCLHLIFWTLYFIGLIGCKRLNLRLLKIAFVAILTLLILTMYGCATYYNAATLEKIIQ